jgi:hypothetical protein
MLVEIPVTITFDHQEPTRPGGRGHSKVFTMRYDTVDTDVLAQWTGHYPPRPNAHWITDTEGVLFDLFTAEADKSIRRMAEQDPETYAARVAA